MAILANELRIGNWVSQKYAEYGLANNSKGYYFSNNQIKSEDLKWCEDYPDNYNPIPLTPEILEKCGFKKWGFRETDVNYELMHANMGLASIVFDKEDDYCYLDFEGTKASQEIVYLHQLQNLVHALTGAELEVKL